MSWPEAVLAAASAGLGAGLWAALAVFRTGRGDAGDRTAPPDAVDRTAPPDAGGLHERLLKDHERHVRRQIARAADPGWGREPPQFETRLPWF